MATLVGTSLSTAQAERTFYGEQRAEAYSEFLTVTNDATDALQAAAREIPDGSIGNRANAETRTKVFNAYQRVRLVGTEEAEDRASRYFIVLLSRAAAGDGDYRDALVAARTEFFNQARADLAPGG
ncbi:hypothetical protein [Pseudonocardia sp. ICBG162]|uniref:hypothetical protein n=1 Tax=Pseudonocardia sp. ICBG162 TaxID=2846761 RepID=UPI001CF63098|nr:hypothetical protein [Pseudonocardia sp. ICBG162]